MLCFDPSRLHVLSSSFGSFLSTVSLSFFWGVVWSTRVEGRTREGLKNKAGKLYRVILFRFSPCALSFGLLSDYFNFFILFILIARCQWDGLEEEQGRVRLCCYVVFRCFLCAVCFFLLGLLYLCCLPFILLSFGCAREGRKSRRKDMSSCYCVLFFGFCYFLWPSCCLLSFIIPVLGVRC